MWPQDSCASRDNYEFAEHDPFTRRSKPARPGIRFFNSSGSGFSSRNIVDTDRIHEALLREFSAGEMEKWRPALRMAVEDGVLTVHFRIATLRNGSQPMCARVSSGLWPE